MDQPQLGRFGDVRLCVTGNALLEAMRKHRSMCLHVLGSDRNQTRRFNDFLDNEAVGRDEMLVHAGRLTARAASGRHVLVIADTTEIAFATHTGRKKGFGVGGDGRDIGVFVHPILAMDADLGGILGLVGATAINRTDGKVGDRGRCAGRRCDDHHGRRSRRRHLRPVRPPPGQRAFAGPRGPGPLGGRGAETVRDLRRLAGIRVLRDRGATQAGRIRPGGARVGCAPGGRPGSRCVMAR